MQDEKDRKIEALTKQIQELTKKVETLNSAFSRHEHLGTDGSPILKSSINLQSGQGFQAGRIAMAEIPSATTSTPGRFFGTIGVGQDSDISNGSQNAQLSIDHYSDDTTTLNTFIYAYRGPIAFGTGATVTAAGSTATLSGFVFDVNGLDGAYLTVYDPANPGEFETYEIASNTAEVITITGGTWGFSASGAIFAVFMPVYFGSADFPYRRLYTGPDSGGGLRFGFGNTNGGQNGLLYMSGQDLKWRKPDGTVTTVQVV